MNRSLCLVPSLLVALVAVPTFAGQVADPKADFLQALARFSLALDGTYGDEGSGVRSNLDSIDQGLKQWDAAIRTYESAMTSELGAAEPDLAVRMHVALGGVYLDRRRVEDALRQFAAATRLDPGRANVYALQGLTYSQLLNNPEAATDPFRKALALDPRDPVRAYVLARHLVKIGELVEAKKALQLFQERWEQRAVEQGRTAVESPFVRLGLVQETAGIEPFFPPALYVEGFALLQRGEYERAIVQFREAAARDSLMAATSPEMEAMGRAAAAFRDGSLQGALEHLRAAVELAPDRAEPHRILGVVYLADEQYDNSVNELRTAIRLSPRDERARLALAEALAEMDQHPAAAQALRETIAALPASGRARYQLGRVYQRQGLYAEALRALEEAVTFNPLLGLNGIYQLIGALKADQQDFDGAIDAYTKRIEVHPNDADGHQKLGETYVRMGGDDEAMAEFAVVLMLNPENSAAYAAMGQVHLRAGRYTDAVEMSQRALELDPAHNQARYALATSLLRLGKTEEGRQELEVFQRLQAESMAARSRLLELDGLRREAAVSAANGDHEKAIALLRKALLYDPAAPSSHVDLGLALVKAGQPAEAIERFKTAVALNAHFEVHKHLAEGYAALGQLEESQKERANYHRMRQEALRRRGANR